MSTHYIEAQRLADTVMIMSHGKAVAAVPAQLVAEHAGREVIEVYGPPAKLAEAEASAQAAGLRSRRTGTSISVLGIDDLDGRAPAGERRPANLEDVFVLLTGEEIARWQWPPQPRPARLGRLERPALTGVLVREVVNYSSYWKSSTFSSTVEPTIYLLAFGFGFGSIVSTIGGYDYVDFVGTGTVATAVLFSSAFAAMFRTFVKYQFQHVRRDPGARRHRGARPRRGPVDGDARGRLRLRPDARRDRVRARTVLGHVRRALHRVDRRLRLGVLRDLGGGLLRSRSENFNYVERRAHPDVPAGQVDSSRSTSFHGGRGSSRRRIRCTASSSCVTPCSGSTAGRICCRSGI